MFTTNVSVNSKSENTPGNESWLRFLIHVKYGYYF